MILSIRRIYIHEPRFFCRCGMGLKAWVIMRPPKSLSGQRWCKIQLSSVKSYPNQVDLLTNFHKKVDEDEMRLLTIVRSVILYSTVFLFSRLMQHLPTCLCGSSCVEYKFCNRGIVTSYVNNKIPKALVLRTLILDAESFKYSSCREPSFVD